MSYPPLITFCAALLVIAIAIIDSRSHRIPNALTVSAAAVGLVANTLIAGAPGALTCVTGLLAGLAIFLPLFLAGGFSAGDVKAMGAVGAFLGAKGVLLAAGFTLIAGAVAGLAFLLMFGGRAAMLTFARRWTLHVFVAWATHRAPSIAPPADDPAARRFPYGAAIACGTLVSLAWRSFQ